MWFKIYSYLNFIAKSSNQHGVHSPFIFNLITKCFYQKTNNKKVDCFLMVQKELMQNKNSISVTDFGSGSRIFKSNERRVSDIAKIAGISNKKAFLLIRLVEYFSPNTILEIGTSVGLSAASMAIGSNLSKITTLEGCKNTSEVSTELFKTFNFKNIELITGNFNNILPIITAQNKFDFIYFDGNHQKEATISYFNECLKSIHNDSIFIFDDIYWNKNMQEAWNEIKENSLVTVTINTYFWGIVFFRKEQKKQHFLIRI